MNEMFNRVKTFVQENTPEILYSVALVAASATITALVINNDEPEIPDGFIASKDDFERMRDTGDCILIRTYDYGDFLLGTSPI
jgi:hypothetical protein